MAIRKLTDEQWRRISKHIPKKPPAPKGGRPCDGNRHLPDEADLSRSQLMRQACLISLFQQSQSELFVDLDARADDCVSDLIFSFFQVAKHGVSVTVEAPKCQRHRPSVADSQEPPRTPRTPRCKFSAPLRL